MAGRMHIRSGIGGKALEAHVKLRKGGVGVSEILLIPSDSHIKLIIEASRSGQGCTHGS